ncbi:hypothetical protein B484DRAFT_470387, partial [Ochromonadaceae sp. CCMP2298]
LEYLQISMALVNRVPLSNDGFHIHVVLSTSLKEGFIFAMLLPSEGFDWEAGLADATWLGADAVFAENEFQWMRVMYVKETGGVVAACVGDTPSVHVPEGPLVFPDMVHALVLVDWFEKSLEVSGAITAGRKRAAEGDADGGPAAAKVRGGLEAPAAGESSAAVPALAVDARRAPVFDLDGCPHTSKVDTEERVEDMQFLLRMLDPPRLKAFTRHLLFRGGTLLESAYEAAAPGCESGATGSAPGLSALQDLRSLPFLAGGAGDGSPFHSFAHGKWRSGTICPWAAS